MGRIIFFDLDGTLWDRYEQIPPGAVQAVRDARKNGHLVFINTGRTRGYIRNPALFAMGVDGMVSGCGTLLEWRGELPALDPAMENNRVFYRYDLHPDRVAAAIRVLRAHRFRILLAGVRFMYADMEEFAGDAYMRKVRERMGDALLPIAELEGQWQTSKMSCDAALSSDPEAAVSALGEEWSVLWHNRSVCELVPRGHSKAEGLRRIAEIFHVPVRDTVAFGDGGNDVDMLIAAGTGVAMTDGSPAALAACDRTAPPLAENGIRTAMRELGLIS